ncbi:DUF226 domain-containing protein [Borrelia crocidurae]|uniref:Plasmid partitioning associated protein-1 n=1 Tax=Borrelia crocidurae (strain Achema) TaxID=1155096 RepID=I0FFG7_BORCA|nr:DUF226 domain-containing protein [Borrelia crocidurae]AFI32223.1 Plasmid partitioning associated protein-1 [Borrelia crocidurae str. Achema]
MDNVLARLKEKKFEIKEKKDKSIFIKIDKENNRKLYHTKIMKDFYAFGVDKRQTHKFFISFRGLFNQEKIEFFSLFSLKRGDKFLGIFYGHRKPIKNVIIKYEENGLIKSSTFSKVYYIEFRFKKGSIYCYIKGIYRLLKKDKVYTKYCEALIEKLSKLEKEVHMFYNKKLSEGGLITKWIEKNQK